MRRWRELVASTNRSLTGQRLINLNESVMYSKRSWLIPIAVSASLGTGSVGAAEKADLILYDGKVLTVDKDFSIKSAVVVKDGKIVAVGGNELVDA